MPLHKLYIQSLLVTGEVLIGVTDSLHICGVEELLGNDLSEDCCKQHRPVLVVSVVVLM